jgi:hypothetical protein
MSLDRALRIEKEAQSRYADLFNDARRSHYTREKIRERTAEIRAMIPKGTPGHVHSYLWGYVTARHDEIYRRDLAWIHSLDGVLVTRVEVDADKQVIDGLTAWMRVNRDSELSRHVWKGEDGKPLWHCPYDERFLGVVQARKVAA